MNNANIDACSEAISVLLLGTQLDSIRAYSLIMQLGFVRTVPAGGLPTEVWVSISGNLITEDASTCSTGDFFERRAQALCATYLLIGQRVTATNISDSGTLQIDLDAKSLRVEADSEDNLEEIWAVMSDTPDTSVDHRWYMVLDDAGALSVRIPT